MRSRSVCLQRFTLTVLILAVLCSWNGQSVQAGPAQDEASPTPSQPAEFVLPNPSDIIAEVNALRASYSVKPLTAHPVLMNIAQQEVNGIEAGQDAPWRPYGLTLGQWLIKDGYPLSGDLSLDGYRSENWALVTSAQGAIDQLHEWISSNDEAHMNTMLSQYRSDIGVGVAGSRNAYGIDQIYMVIETALRTGSGQQQSEARDFLTSLPTIIGGAQSINGTPVALSAAGYIVPVSLSTARPDGDVIHPVRSGQSLWSIAIHYGTTIEQIRRFNNLGVDNTIYQGQKLLVKKGATQPVITPTVTPIPSASPAAPTAELRTATPGSTSTAAAAPQGGNSSSFLGVVLLLLLAGAVVAVSFIRVKN